MKNLKIIALAISSITLPLAASDDWSEWTHHENSNWNQNQYSDWQHGCSDWSHNGCVWLCDPEFTWGIDCRALILKPTGSSLGYAVEAFPEPIPTPSWKTYDIKTDYHAGFDLGLTSFWHSRNIQCKLNWQHLHSTDTSKKFVSTQNMIGPFFEIGPDALLYKKAKGKVHFAYDEIDLDAGICVNFGDYLQTNFFAGICGAQVKQNLTSKFSNNEGNVARSIKTPSKFIGAGPQVGVDLLYSLLGGLNITGQATASLLVGDMKNHTTYKSISPALQELDIESPNVQGTHNTRRTQVVPAFAGRLGLSYTYEACSWAFSIEAGYEAKVFINAIQSADIGSEVITPPVLPDTIGVFARTFQRKLSNFALSGPYIKCGVYF